MPSTAVCIYEGCNNSKKKNPDLSFHRFPKNEQTRLEWIARTGTAAKNLSDEKLNDARICCKHFINSDFISYGKNGKRTVKAGALPIDVGLSRTRHTDNIENGAINNSVLADGIVPIIPETDLINNCTSSSVIACGPRSDIRIIGISPVIPPIRIQPASDSSQVSVKPTNPTISAEIGSTATSVDSAIFSSACNSPVLPTISDPFENLTSENIPAHSCPNISISNVTHVSPRIQASPRSARKSRDSVRSVNTSIRSRRKKPRVVTSKEAELSRLVNTLRSQIKVKNQKIKRMEVAAENVAHHVAFGKAICESLNESQLAFVHMQLNHVKHKKWSEEEKQFALSLFYRSPKAYVFLRDNQKFALPCVSLIRKWINELNLSPGINATVIEALTIKSQTMTTEERQCVLMWDEMSIRRMLEYNPKADLVEGFQDLGELGRTNECANYALVFMVRGLRFTWKQPISYVVSHGNVLHGDLVKLLLAVIDAIFSTGLIVKFLVCDQGSSNRTALTSLGVTESKPFIERGGYKIFFGFDVPHLMKSTRNNLINRDFIIDNDIVSWGVIRELRDVERNRVCEAAPKLTDRHVNPNNFQKMSVSLATQVYSHSVSAAINTGKVTGDLKHPHCIATANFVKRMTDLFDCLNSRTPSDSNPLKRALSSLQPQVEEYLRNSLSWIEKWTVSSGLPPPCFEGIRLTVRSVLLLWEDLRNDGCLYLITSRLNQDPLENLFAVMRYRSGHNDNPSAMSFRRNLQYAMTANLMKPSASTNCELDDTTALLAVEMNSARQNLSDDEAWINKAIVRNHVDFWSVDGECAIHREWIIKLFVRVHVFNRLKWLSRDMRDRVKSKRPAGSAPLKPNRILKKITHQ